MCKNSQSNSIPINSESNNDQILSDPKDSFESMDMQETEREENNVQVQVKEVKEIHSNQL